MMFFLHKMDCGVLGAVEVGEECWRGGRREGGKEVRRLRKVRGQRAAVVVARDRGRRRTESRVGGRERERERASNRGVASPH